MAPKFFAKPSDFRKWLEKNHTSEKELLVGFYKTGTKKESITWPESVDQALCFGWIDGIRKSIDAESYSIRFTPRKASSIWSAVNIKKIETLTQSGLMQPAGIAAFEKRKEEKSAIYSHENKGAEFSEAFLKQFQADKKAWEFFSSQPPSYRQAAIHIVMTAKQEKTQQSRLAELIADSLAGLRWKRLRR